MGRNNDSVRADGLMYDLAKANQRISELEAAIHEKAAWPRPRITKSISQATKEDWARRIAEMTDAASLHQRFNYQEYIDAVLALMTNKP